MAGAPLTQDFPETDGGAHRGRSRGIARVNVGDLERVASGVIGGALVLFGLRRRSLGGVTLALLGGDLVHRGITGHCEVYQALDVSTADGDAAAPAGAPDASATVDQRITIQRPADEVYRAWRNPDALAHVLGDAATVRRDSPTREHWVVRAPLGREIAFDTEVTEERPGALLRWQSLPGALVPHEGMLRFTQAPNDWGTEVELQVRYDPPGGVLGDAAAKAFSGVPNTLADRTLRRFKSLVETGEIATLAHNPSGRRDTAGGQPGGITLSGHPAAAPAGANGPHLPLSDHTT